MISINARAARLLRLSLVASLVCAGRSTSAALTIDIVNQNTTHTNPADIYFMFGGGPSVNGTLNGSTPLVTGRAYSLSQLTSGIQLEEFRAGRMYISLGSPLTSATAGNAYNPNFNNSSLPDYGTRWDKVEMTYLPNPQDGKSVANLSATDFFSVPLEIRTYTAASPNPVQTLSWRDSTASIFEKLAPLSNLDSQTVITGSGGVKIAGGHDVLRVISPSTTANHAAYSSFSDYLNSVHGVVTSIKGQYSNGSPSAPPPKLTQTYDFTATVAAAANPGKGFAVGDLVLEGHGSVATTPATIIIKSDQLSTGIYTANPPYTVNGAAANQGDNDVYAAAVRDVLGALNLGFVNSDAINPNTGHPYKNDSSDKWFIPPVPADKAFAYAQPSHSSYYNQYAYQLSQTSDAYGFPYTDLLAKVQADLTPPNITRMEIVILSDARFGATIPEPSTMLLAFCGLTAFTGRWHRRRESRSRQPLQGRQFPPTSRPRDRGIGSRCRGPFR